MDSYFPLNFPVHLYQKAGPLHLHPAEIVSCTEFYFQVAKTDVPIRWGCVSPEQLHEHSEFVFTIWWGRQEKLSHMIIKVIMMHEKKWLYNYKLRKGIQRSLDQLSLTIRASVFRKETSVWERTSALLHVWTSPEWPISLLEWVSAETPKRWSSWKIRTAKFRWLWELAVCWFPS